MMAKTKAVSPKKGKKPTTIRKAVTALRRSPRKAVQSAKALAAEEDIESDEIVKPAGTKKTTTVKSSSKGTATKSAAASGVSKTSAPKNQTSTTAVVEPMASPKRGRPRKETKTTAAKGKARTPSESRVSSRTRSQTPPDAPVLEIENGWTDSPKKQRLSKTTSSKAASKAAFEELSAKKAFTGGIRKSIEFPNANARARSSSQTRNASTSPERGRKKPSTAGAGSVVSNRSSVKGRSRNPARKNSKPLDVDVATANETAPSPKRGRAASPQRRASSRSVSPAKLRADNGEARTTSPTLRSRDRSKSPSKANSRKASNASPKGTATSTSAESPRPRGRPRASSVSRQLSPIRVEKTRASRSPAKASPKAIRRSKSAGPKDSERVTTATRRLSDPSPARGRRRSTSPSKRQPQQNKSPQRSPSHTAFLKRFAQNDDYGKSLQKAERTAFLCKGDARKVSNTRFPLISKEDKELAVEKGLKRADLMTTLNTKGAWKHSKRAVSSYGAVLNGESASILSSNELRVLAHEAGHQLLEPRYEPTSPHYDPTSPLVDLMSPPCDLTSPLVDLMSPPCDLSPPPYDLSEPPYNPLEPGYSQRSPQYKNPNPGRNPSSPGTRQIKLSRSSPQRRRSSGNSQQSPKRGTAQSRSRTSRSPSRTQDDTASLAEGEPSGEGRGAIHSVTNPYFIEDTKPNRRNPFFETLPASEVWNRRMPRFLPFGETPFMEREMSRQISGDLAKDAEKSQSSSWWNPFGKSKSPTTQSRPYKSPWILPDVSDVQIAAATRELKNVLSAGAGLDSPKRKASEALPGGSVKRVRRRSKGDEAMMSGAL